MPDEFRQRGCVEYLFVQEIRALKLETPGIAKINIYCEANPEKYKREVFNGITDIDVRFDWEKLKQLNGPQKCATFLDLLVHGTKSVLSEFSISSELVDTIKEKIKQLNFSLYIPLGKKNEKSDDGTISARLFVSNHEQFTRCDVFADVFEGRRRIGHFPVCVTFPMPEMAIDRFEGLKWDVKGNLVATFTIPNPKGRTVFTYENFSIADNEGVTITDQVVASTPFSVLNRKFTIDIFSLLNK